MLGGFALSLLAVVALRYEAGSDGAATRTDEAVRARMETLNRVVAGHAAIGSQYAEIGAAFAERFAEVPIYQTKGKARVDAVVAFVRTRLEAAGKFQNLTVSTGATTPAGDGIARAVVNVAFTAVNDREAAEAIRQFTQPATGIAWQSLTVTADRKEHRIGVTGKLAALMVDAVE